MDTTMKTATKPAKSTSDKPKVKSNLKAAFGKYKGIIVEKYDCWVEDLKKTIGDEWGICSIPTS